MRRTSDFCVGVLANIANLDFPRIDPEAFPSSPEAVLELCWSSKAAFDSVLRNTGFYSTGPSPGVSGRVLGSRVLPSRAACFFSLPLHGAKHSSFISPCFKNLGWGRSGDRTPCTRRPLRDPVGRSPPLQILNPGSGVPEGTRDPKQRGTEFWTFVGSVHSSELESIKKTH